MDIPTQPALNGGAKSARERLADIEHDIEDMQKIIQDQAIEIATLKERLSIFNVGQAALTLVVGAIATWLGRQ